jgi:hypothetical protein
MVAFGFVHGAEGAGIVGAANGTLQKIALPLSWRTINVAFIAHGIFLLVLGQPNPQRGDQIDNADNCGIS